jgi:hypothetical protein
MPGIFGDVTPVGGDGFVDVGDILCELAAFAECHVSCPGACGANCNCSTPDLLPACKAPCGYTVVIDVADILAALDAFLGTATYQALCPCGPCDCGALSDGGLGMGPEGGAQNNIILSLNPSSLTVSPGGTVDVDMFVTGPESFRGYQAAIQISGGRRGTLTLETLSINEQNTTFVYLGQQYITTLDTNGGRLMAGMYSGGVSVGSAVKYLGRFKLRASNDALGTFTVNPRADTMLRDSANQTIPWTTAGTLAITVE